MKVTDITEKLNFEEKPQIKIKDTVLTVNNEAAAILEAISKSENMEGHNIKTLSSLKAICDIIFDETERRKLDEFHLNLTDYITVIQSAVELVAGTASGETQTRTMT